MPPAFQWARLQTNVKCALRRGAWYRILKLTSSEVIVDVKGKPVSVPRGDVQLSPVPALRWTVVPFPQNAPRYPPDWGPHYAVCPNCRDRSRLEGQPSNLRCRRCNGLFDIDWNEPYLAAGTAR